MFSFSVAFDKNRGIGICDGLPWHIKEELALFRKNTINKNIIMGRKTYQNLPGKLKNRNIFIVTSDINYQQEDCTIINDFTSFRGAGKFFISSFSFIRLFLANIKNLNKSSARLSKKSEFTNIHSLYIIIT